MKKYPLLYFCFLLIILPSINAIDLYPNDPYCSNCKFYYWEENQKLGWIKIKGDLEAQFSIPKKEFSNSSGLIIRSREGELSIENIIVTTSDNQQVEPILEKISRDRYALTFPEEILEKFPESYLEFNFIIIINYSLKDFAKKNGWGILSFVTKSNSFGSDTEITKILKLPKNYRLLYYSEQFEDCKNYTRDEECFFIEGNEVIAKISYEVRLVREIISALLMFIGAISGAIISLYFSTGVKGLKKVGKNRLKEIKNLLIPSQ